MPRVIISDTAIRRIRKIHSYYSKKASPRTAEKIVNEIFASIRHLESQPLAWQEEDHLRKMKKGHRRIVSGNYKIVYRVQQDFVLVTDIFDSRQNPKKISP